MRPGTGKNEGVRLCRKMLKYRSDIFRMFTSDSEVIAKNSLISKTCQLESGMD